MKINEDFLPELGLNLDFKNENPIKIGKWLNGKTLYLKAVEGTTVAGDQVQITVDSGMFYGWILTGFVYASGGSQVPLNYYSSSSLYIKSSIISGGILQVTTSSSSGWINGAIRAIVMYAK